jgi:hypothetical protein
MPNVLHVNGFDVMIYPNDHRPAHVHVFKNGLVVIKLNNRRTAPSVREVYGMPRQDVRAALALVTENKRLLVRAWRNRDEAR